MTVCVYGRERIAATLRAAKRVLPPTDQVIERLERAVQRDDAEVWLPDVLDTADAHVLAEIFEHYRNGDDKAGSRAAARLRSIPSKTKACPRCGGSGEVEC